MALNANYRTDAYGGAIDDRVRFELEVTAAVVDRVGPARTGIRLSPGGRLGGIDEGSEGPDLYRRLVAGLADFNLAYLHLVQTGDEDLLHDIRRLWPNSLLANRANRPLEALGADIEAGLADLAPVGRWALANPDFVARVHSGAPLNELDPSTLYGGGTAGYTGYPTLEEAALQMA